MHGKQPRISLRKRDDLHDISMARRKLLFQLALLEFQAIRLSTDQFLMQSDRGIFPKEGQVGQPDLFRSLWLRTNDESVWHLCQVLDDQRQRFLTRERSLVRQPILLGIRPTDFRLFHVFQPALEHTILE